MVNNYVLDPAHVTTVRADAAGGHMGGMANGSSRYGVGGLPFGVPPGMQPGLPNPAAFATPFGHYAVTMPSGWTNGGAGYGADAGMQMGPMRRGGGRFVGRAQGPYDRQSKDNRNARWGNSGRLSPPGRRPSIGGPPRFADAAGAAAVGPREAVTGRSLKSYEDLDAVAGGGDGELNY